MTRIVVERIPEPEPTVPQEIQDKGRFTVLLSAPAVLDDV